MATGEDGGARSNRELHNPTLSRGEIFRESIRLESGGGPGYDPQTPAEVRRRLGGRASELAREAAERTPAELGSSGRVIVEAKVLPNYLAASHTPLDLIDSSGLAIVGTRPARGEHRTAWRDPDPDAPAKVYLLSGSPADAGRLAELLQPESPVPEKIYGQLAQLDELALGSAETIVDIDEALLEYDGEGRALLEAVLHPQIGEHGVGDEVAQARNIDAFGKYLATLDTDARHSAAAIEDGVAFVSVAVDPAAVPLVARYTQLRVLRPMSALREPPEFLEAEEWELEDIVQTVTGGEERIALFDGGLSPRLQELFGDLVTVTDLTNDQAVLPTHERHGGWVTSAALLGHLDPAERTPNAGVPVDAFRVWPPPREVSYDAELRWVLDRIVEVLQAGHHRVAVITLAPKMNADQRAEPHQWTSALDRIAREHDVLICVAAGNTGHLAPSADRLLIPADAINALSVGAAIAATGPVVRTDYSSVGPGRPGQTTAPTGVQFGGDLGAGQPFFALGEDGRMQAVNGTSLAAPVVARACALLRHALGGQANANLLRCLAAHGADRVVGQAQTAEGSTAREVGFGRLPADLVSHLEHTPDEVTVVYRDTVLRGEQIALPFPFPDELFEEHHNRRFRLRWTLSFMPSVETSNPVDYATAGFDVFYRPHAQTYTLRDPDELSEPVRINRLHEGTVFDGLIREGWLPSARPATSGKPGWATEVESRARDGKWETLIRVDTQPRGKGLYRPGIDLHFLTRLSGSLLHEPVEMPFVLAVTLQGPSGSGAYGRVQNYASALTPLVASVPVSIHSTMST